MIPWFIATEPFGPQDGERWRNYISWSGLTQLVELVSLDGTLCRTVLPKLKKEYWPYTVNQDYMLRYFRDLDYLRGELVGVERFNLLCVVRNPSEEVSIAPIDAFRFHGYDLVEAQTGISALTNCGGFLDVFANSELSPFGLLTDFRRARQVQVNLKTMYPNEPHAHCDLWAISRFDETR
jgi:hypothetical protein